MRKILIILPICFLSSLAYTQSKEAGTDRAAIKQFASNKDTMHLLSGNGDVDAVKAVLKQYNAAIEKLDVTGTEKLFTSDSKIFESGGSEGTFAHYLEHHLGPEFKEFTSFKFNDYKVDIQLAGNYAFATETYGYSIVVAKDKSEVKRKGITTSVLKKTKGTWKIMISHNSSRRG